MFAILSSNFPRFERNLNLGGNNYETRAVVPQRCVSFEAISVGGEDYGCAKRCGDD